MTRLTAFTLFSVLGLSLACGSPRHRHHDGWEEVDPASCGGEVQRGSIDVDAALEVDPGTGVGVFIEHESGGRWRLYTTCDTDVSGFECFFDILAKPLDGAPIVAVAPDSLERDDRLHFLGSDSVQLRGWTGPDSDGFLLDTDPFAPLSVDVLLDGSCGNQYIYWIGNGAIHQGAPSNPFELEPIER